MDSAAASALAASLQAVVTEEIQCHAATQNLHRLIKEGRVSEYKVGSSPPPPSITSTTSCLSRPPAAVEPPQARVKALEAEIKCSHETLSALIMHINAVEEKVGCRWCRLCNPHV